MISCDLYPTNCNSSLHQLISLHISNIFQFFTSAGPTYVICRPIHVPEVQGSALVEGPDSSTFYLRDSKAFPLEEPFWEKVIQWFILYKV